MDKRRPTTTISVSDVRQQLADILNRVAYGNERIVLERHGRAIAAVVPIGDLAVLEANTAEANRPVPAAPRPAGRGPRSTPRA